MTDKICSLDGCKSKVLARNFCSKHYEKYMKYGNTLEGYEKIPDGERLKFVESIINTKETTCISWPYSDNGIGYGTIIVDGKKWYSHRYILYCKEPKENFKDLDVRHSCGKGHLGCVNPNHLSWGTRKQNFEDKKIHGTYIHGTDMPGNVLSEENVKEIYDLSWNSNLYKKDIASMFGCSQQEISKIKLRKTWSWLTSSINKDKNV